MRRSWLEGEVSRRVAVYLLWAVFFATLPLPFYMGASGVEPPLGVSFLAALAGGIWLAEGNGGTTGMFAGLALAQAVLYTLLAGLAAALAARLIWAVLPRRAPLAVGLLCAVLLLRGYRMGGKRLLLWSGLCFIGLTVSNTLVFIDLTVAPHIDLYVWRLATAALAMALLLYGLVWESD